MEPVLETIQPNPGNSFFLTSGPYGATEPFWHIHPEYEIVYIKNGSAEQHVGSHFSKYTNGTLLFIGPNIPHSNMGNFDYDDNLAVVIQMSRDFLENKIGSIQEFSFINNLIKQSKQGIWFGSEIQNELRPKLESIDKYDSYNKLICLIEILKSFALTSDYKLLNANEINYNHESNSYNRVAVINKYVTKNFNRTIQLRELADITGLTESSFSRFFKKITGKTFVTFLNEYRVHKACELLTNNNSNISEVMYNTGFNEAAHFSRVFKKHTGYTPREYRAILKNSSRLKFE
jgi:AraC-like DNA-binding protein